MHLIVAAADPFGVHADRVVPGGGGVARSGAIGGSHGQPVGESAVYRIAPVESDVPERSVRRAAALARVAGGWPADLPRPVRLLDPPQPIDAMAFAAGSSAGRVHLAAVRHRVRHADGPERIAGEWWKRDRGMDLGAGLFPRRGRKRAAFLAVPEGERERCGDGGYAVVPARVFLMYRGQVFALYVRAYSVLFEIFISVLFVLPQQVFNTETERE